jgi:hypothetical protein
MSENAMATPARGPWITLGAAAAKMGVSIFVVNDLIRQKRLSVMRLRTWKYVSATEVEALIEQSITPAREGV